MSQILISNFLILLCLVLILRRTFLLDNTKSSAEDFKILLYMFIAGKSFFLLSQIFNFNKMLTTIACNLMFFMAFFKWHNATDLPIEFRSKFTVNRYRRKVRDFSQDFILVEERSFNIFYFLCPAALISIYLGFEFSNLILMLIYPGITLAIAVRFLNKWTEELNYSFRIRNFWLALMFFIFSTSLFIELVSNNLILIEARYQIVFLITVVFHYQALKNPRDQSYSKMISVALARLFFLTLISFYAFFYFGFDKVSFEQVFSVALVLLLIAEPLLGALGAFFRNLLFEPIRNKEREIMELFEELESLEDDSSFISLAADKLRNIGVFAEVHFEYASKDSSKEVFSLEEKKNLEFFLKENGPILIEDLNQSGIFIKKVKHPELIDKIKDLPFDFFWPVSSKDQLHGIICAKSEISSKRVIQYEITSLEFLSDQWIKKINQKKRALEISRQKRVQDISQFGGVLAHELRNPVTIIKGAVEVLDESDSSTENRELLDLIKVHTLRLDEVISDFLKFSKMSPDQSQAHPLKEIIIQIEQVKSEMSLKQKQKAADISIVNHCEALTNEILVDLKKLKDVIHNLISNSYDAFDPDRDSALKIDISINAKKSSLEIEIRDNAGGIPEEYKARIFEPFVSSKNHGNGLGLAISKRYMQDMKGDIELRDDIKGAVFLLRLCLI